MAGVFSLIGAGRQNVLRTIENISKPPSLLSYVTRKNAMPMLDTTVRKANHNIGKCHSPHPNSPLASSNSTYLTTDLYSFTTTPTQ